MRSRLIYVELKTGFSDNGPAWIGMGRITKSGRTVYFNGKTLTKTTGISGNFLDLSSGSEYWVSGVKKNGTDRRYAGGGKTKIDRTVIEFYLTLRNLQELPMSQFEIAELDNSLLKTDILKEQ